MQILKFAMIALLACCLIACASQNKDYYKNSQTIPRMVTPRGLSSAKIKDKYPVPSAETTKPYKSVSLIPPGAGTLP